MVVALVGKTLMVHVGLSQHVYGLSTEIISNEKLLEVKLKHLLADNAAYWNGSRILQGEA